MKNQSLFFFKTKSIEYKIILVLISFLFLGSTSKSQSINLQSNFSVNEGIGIATFTINLSVASANTITVNYNTSNNSASSPSDYTSTSGTLTFLPGQISKTVNVSIANDYLYEGAETFYLNLSSPIGATLGISTCGCTIQNDDPFISFILPIIVSESAGQQVCTIILSSAQTYPVSVNYATSNSSANGGTDFVAANGTIVFLPGETTKQITITILNDYMFETTEIYYITLSNALQADLSMPMTINSNSIMAYISNDDPTIMPLNTTSISENGLTQSFTINLSSAVSYGVSVHYSTSNFTALSGLDYTFTSGDIIFLPGDTTKTIQVPILSDFLHESNEIYSMIFSNAMNSDLSLPMSISTTSVSATIIDDDPYLTVISPMSVSEQDGMQSIPIQLSAAQTYPVTVQYATSNSSAINGTDYISSSGTLTFAPGETMKVVNITILNDFKYESPETYIFQLSNATNANAMQPMTIITSFITPTITNDDPYLSISTTNVNENAGTQLFTISLSNPVSYNVSVQYATQNAGGIAGIDYTATSGIISFAPGETTKTVSINIINDYIFEGTVTYYVLLSNAQNSDMAQPMVILNTLAVGNILNDDPYIILNPPANVLENAGVQHFTVGLSVAQTYSVSVNYSTVNSSAIAGSDFTAQSGTIIFLPGETSKTISINILNDYIFEPDEIYYLNISNAQNINASAPMSIALSSGTGGTILNDDPRINIIQPLAVSENSGTQHFNVTLNPAQQSPVSVNYYTQDLSAHDGTDYIPSSCTITFSPGETSKTISVNLIDDGLIELNEAYLIQLYDPQFVNLGIPVSMQTSSANGNIIDNDTVNCSSTILPTPIVSGNTLYCNNETIELHIDPIPNAIGYVWKGPNGFSATGLSISLTNCNASMSGIYTVKAYQAGGSICDSSSSTMTVVTVSTCTNTLNIKVFLQGFYLNNGFMTTNYKNHALGNNNAMTDSIFIELRDAIQTDSIVASTKTQLNIDGSAIASFPGLNGNFYAVIKHYNTLVTWSANTITLGPSPTFYDFTTSTSQAYGSNQVEVESGVWALYSGDLNQDENIDLLDAAELEVRINNFDSCYLPSDLNGDGNTDLLDTPILESNIEHFIYSIHP